MARSSPWVIVSDNVTSSSCPWQLDELLLTALSVSGTSAKIKHQHLRKYGGTRPEFVYRSLDKLCVPKNLARRTVQGDSIARKYAAHGGSKELKFDMLAHFCRIGDSPERPDPSPDMIGSVLAKQMKAQSPTGSEEDSFVLHQLEWLNKKQLQRGTDLMLELDEQVFGKGKWKNVEPLLNDRQLLVDPELSLGTAVAEYLTDGTSVSRRIAYDAFIPDELIKTAKGNWEALIVQQLSTKSWVVNSKCDRNEDHCFKLFHDRVLKKGDSAKFASAVSDQIEQTAKNWMLDKLLAATTGRSSRCWRIQDAGRATPNRSWRLHGLTQTLTLHALFAR